MNTIGTSQESQCVERRARGAVSGAGETPALQDIATLVPSTRWPLAIETRVENQDEQLTITMGATCPPVQVASGGQPPVADPHQIRFPSF